MKFYFENFKGANSKHRILEHSADMVNKTYESEITLKKKKKFNQIQLGSHISLKKVIHKCQSRCYISSVTVNNICKMFVLENNVRTFSQN